MSSAQPAILANEVLAPNEQRGQLSRKQQHVSVGADVHGALLLFPEFLPSHSAVERAVCFRLKRSSVRQGLSLPLAFSVEAQSNFRKMEVGRPEPRRAQYRKSCLNWRR